MGTMFRVWEWLKSMGSCGNGPKVGPRLFDLDALLLGKELDGLAYHCGFVGFLLGDKLLYSSDVNLAKAEGSRFFGRHAAPCYGPNCINNRNTLEIQLPFPQNRTIVCPI